MDLKRRLRRFSLTMMVIIAFLSMTLAQQASATTGGHGAMSASSVTGGRTIETMVSAPVRDQARPDIYLKGDCGDVNFISYGNGNFYIVINSYQGAIFWVDWQINTFTGSNSGTYYPPLSTHAEFPAQAGTGGPAVLDGDALTASGYCYFIPNPA